MLKSTAKRGRRKTVARPKKPYKDFPLSPHASGKWQKKIRGTVFYFGNWARRENGKLVRVAGDGWQEALALYKAQADDLHAGRTPRPASGDELTVKALSDQFLTAKQRKVDAGELSSRTFAEYVEFCQRMADAFGKSRRVADLCPADFETLRADAAKIWGPHRLGKFVQYIRTAFKYGFEAGLIERPVRFGPEFKRPSKKVMRTHKVEQGERLFTAAEIRQLLAGASVPLRAMILLGINCGFGNSDVSSLQTANLDPAKGWVNFPRPKTGIDRRCPLWPETVAAIQAALAARPKAQDPADGACVFITVRGNRWLQGKTNSVGLEFGKLLKRFKINGRVGLAFYSLRHTFRTEADATKDFPAANLIMGHSDPSMAAVYRERIDDDRLQAVVNHVRSWLFGRKGGVA